MNSVAIPASAPAPALSAEADLVRSAARGDADAFDELFRRHSEPAWRLAQAVAPDRESARDAFRDGFVRALRSARTPRRHSAHPTVFRPEVLGAVYKSAVDQAYDRSASPAARRAHPDATVALTEAAFRSLPERWRAALWLSEVESMDVDRIAPILGVSGAVASQLMIRGKRGLAGRFSQAGQEVPEHLGQLLRAVVLPTPTKLMEETHVRFAAAGSERGPVLAPVAGWLEDRAVRPMSVAIGALVGLGLIGLGVVPQGPALRSQLGANASGSLAGAVPVQTCLGLPCSGGAGTSASSRSALGSTVAGLLGGAGGFGAGSSSSSGSVSSGGSGSGPAGGAGSVPFSSTNPVVTPSGGGTVPATTSTQNPGGGSSGTTTPSGSGSGSPSPTTKSSAPSTVVSLAPVASVTSTGTALNVNLLPSTSGTAPVTATVGGCPLVIGLTLGSTTLGCPSSSTSSTPSASSNTSTGGTSTPTATSGSSTTTSTSGGLSSTISGVTSTVGNTLSPVTSTVGNALSTLTSGL